MEKRPPAKGNPEQTTVTGTQRPEPALSGLDRVREAAKRDKEPRFTNLLHHVTIERRLFGDNYPVRSASINLAG